MRQSKAPPRGRARGREPKSRIAVIFWLGLVVLFMTLYLLNRETIERNLFRLSSPQASSSPAPQATPDMQATERTATTARPTSTPRPAATPQTGPSTRPQTSPSPSATPIAGSRASPRPSPGIETARVARVLWFIEEPGDDGAIRMAEAGRLVIPGDSPLRETLVLLMEGPNKTERDRRLMSLIPPGTEIASVAMSGSTAVIGVSESFADNRFGNEGIWIRIKQIVYTATQFKNVASVRIELKRKGAGGTWDPSPLGDVIGDGIFLGRTYTRADLP